MCAIKLFLLISCTIVTFAQVCWANNCNCDPVDSLCQEKCVTSTNVCIVNCGRDTECYIQCVNDYWPGNTFSDSKGNHTVAGSDNDDKKDAHGKITKSNGKEDVRDDNDDEEDTNCADNEEEVEIDDNVEEEEEVIDCAEELEENNDDEEEEQEEDSDCSDIDDEEESNDEAEEDIDCPDDEPVEEEREEVSNDDAKVQWEHKWDDDCEDDHEFDIKDEDSDEASPKDKNDDEKEQDDEDNENQDQEDDESDNDVEQDDEASDNNNIEQGDNEEGEEGSISETGKEESDKNIDDGSSKFENITQPSIVGRPNESGSPSQTLSDGSTVMASVTESVSEGASIVSTPVSTGLMTDVPVISFSSADGSAVTTHTTVTSQITVSPTPLENSASNLLKNGLFTLYNPAMLLIMLFSGYLFVLA